MLTLLLNVDVLEVRISAADMYAELSNTNEELVLSLLTVGDTVNTIMGLV